MYVFNLIFFTKAHGNSFISKKGLVKISGMGDIMKKIGIISLLFILVFLTSCRQEKTTTMRIQKAELSQQETQLLELISQKDTNAIFDYCVDDKVKSVTVMCYELGENGDWINHGGGSYPIDREKGRIAVSLNNIGEKFRVGIEKEDGIVFSEHNFNESIDISNLFENTSIINSEEIKYEKEIPVAMQIITSSESVMNNAIKYFYEPQKLLEQKYKYVYAITVEFSETEL